ncbi:MAG: response regulator transcription factor, partial [Acinetobacter sp.]
DVEVALAIRSILRGGAPIDPFVAREILKQISIPTISGTVEHNRPAADQETLTQREQEILSLVAQGLSNREIAEQLCVSRYTVESHIKHIYRKLSVSKRTKAVSTARHLGIL